MYAKYTIYTYIQQRILLLAYTYTYSYCSEYFVCLLRLLHIFNDTIREQCDLRPYCLQYVVSKYVADGNIRIAQEVKLKAHISLSKDV